MQISHISVSNFKSLMNFQLSLHGFNCLIGLNGAGKSTVLQFMDFLAQQVKGDLDEWLEERSWKAMDINCKLGKSRKRLVTYEVWFKLEGGKRLLWQSMFNPTELKSTSEDVYLVEQDNTSQSLLNVVNGKYALDAQSSQPIPFDYQGSIVSQLKEKDLPVEVKQLKAFLLRFRSLELLTPQFLRAKARNSGGELGLGGQRLSAFIHEMPEEHKKKLETLLIKAYPKLKGVDTRALRSGWKELNIAEEFSNQQLSTEAQHVNDGLLRIMAILAQLMTDHSVMAFDEVENGINPELIEFLIDTLVEAEQQVLVTTHSPMILNFMEDDVAVESVQYLYKTDDGYTRSIPFFSIPSIKEKLTVMGPGEVFIDTDLTRLGDEIAALTQE
nr:AAA family ATPase [Endozoicomonas sp.]